MRGILQAIRREESRDKILQRAVEAGWSKDFAAWVYTKVKYEGEFELLPPTDDRVLRTRGRRDPVRGLAQVGVVGGFYALTAIVGGLFGFVLVPRFSTLKRLSDGVFNEVWD